MNASRCTDCRHGYLLMSGVRCKLNNMAYRLNNDAEKCEHFTPKATPEKKEA